MATRAKRDEDRPFSSDKPWGWLLEDIMRRDPDRRHELIVKNWIALTSLTQSEVRPLVDLLRFGLEPMPVVRQHIAHMLDPAAGQELRLVVKSRRRKPGPRPAEGNLEDDNSEQTKIRYALRQGNVDPLVSAWRNRRAVGPHACELLAHMLYPSDGTEEHRSISDHGARAREGPAPEPMGTVRKGTAGPRGAAQGRRWHGARRRNLGGGRGRR
jgi:hypothetical protein